MQPKNKPRVTTIVLTWNSADFIRQCLDSVLNSAYPTSIMVVDNDSADDTRDIITTEYPTVTLVNSGANLGYAGGNNFGLRLIPSTTDYVFILNPDATIEPACIGQLVERMESEPALAGASPMIYKSGNIIWDAGGDINWANSQTSHRGDGQADTGQFAMEHYTGRLNGCAMLLRNSAIKKVGLLDENYFLYYEETDWSVRCLDAGYKLGFVAAAHGHHMASASTGGHHGKVFEYYMARNRLYFMHKFRNKASPIWPLRVLYVQIYLLLQVVKTNGFRVCFTVLKHQLAGTKDYRRGKMGRKLFS